jgi:hypothetical protein
MSIGIKGSMAHTNRHIQTQTCTHIHTHTYIYTNFLDSFFCVNIMEYRFFLIIAHEFLFKQPATKKRRVAQVHYFYKHIYTTYILLYKLAHTHTHTHIFMYRRMKIKRNVQLCLCRKQSHLKMRYSMRLCLMSSGKSWDAIWHSRRS